MLNGERRCEKRPSSQGARVFTQQELGLRPGGCLQAGVPRVLPGPRASAPCPTCWIWPDGRAPGAAAEGVREQARRPQSWVQPPPRR